VGSFSDKGLDLYASVPSIESQISYPDLSFSWSSLVSLKAFSIQGENNVGNPYSIINPFNNTGRKIDITTVKSPKEIRTMEMA
jgi:hypothetical protein